MSIQQEDRQGKGIKNNGCHKETTFGDIPSQKDLEKEIGEYLSKRYGGKVRVVSHMLLPNELGHEEPGGESEKNTRDGQEIHFNLRPEELEAWLNRFVVRQESAKAILATKVCTHFNRIEYLKKKGEGARLPGGVKNNIILIGPTGVGKTFLIKLIADHLGVPFVRGDATKFSETGYVGGDVEDLVRDLVQEAGGDMERASCGIIYIDEIDKIASSSYMQGPDISRAGVQRTLLKLLEETDVDLRALHDPISQIEAIERYRQTGKREKKTINTRNILFIVSGAFSGLSDVIKKRLSRQGIGFGADIDIKDDRCWLDFVKPQDLIEYGFESEFIGRFPVIAVLHELSEDDLYQILKNPDSAIIKSKKQDFKVYGIDLRFDDGALRLLASQAYQEHTGARALVCVLEKALMPFEKRLPSTGIRFLVVTRDLVEAPDAALKDMLSRSCDPDFACKYKNIIMLEKKELHARIKESAAHIWRDAGICLSPKRLEMICHLIVEEDMQSDMAQERLLFWIRRIKEYEDAFFNRCGIKISFEEDAVDILLEGCLKDSKNFYARCETLCNILKYGLTLIKEKVGQTEFNIPGEAVEGAELYINKLIHASYHSSSTREAM
jgi:endopeptidase Clp ATP-binding regulatory subunit ClpX